MRRLAETVRLTMEHVQGPERPCEGCGKPCTTGGHRALCRVCWDKERRARWTERVEQAVASVRETIPAKFRSSDLHDAELRRRGAIGGVIAEASSYIGRSLMLRGSSAAGKTSLAAALLVEGARAMIGPYVEDEEPGDGWRWEEAERCFYALELDLAGARLRHGAGNGEPPILRRAERAPILVLDDLGNARVGEEVIALVYHRLDGNSPTIVCTNRGDADLLDRYGEGFTRRLRESAPTLEMDDA